MADTSLALSIQAARTINVGRGNGGGSPPPAGTLSIAGSGFGSRSALFDHFENYNEYADGTNSQTIGYNSPNNSGDSIVIVSDESHEGWGKSLERLYTAGGDHFPRNYLTVTPSDEIYLAFQAKWFKPVNTAPVGIFKIPRGGSLPNYTGTPRFYETIRSNSAGELTTRDGGFFSDQYVVDQDGPLPFSQGSWHFSEYYFRLSTPGQPDGQFTAWCDGIVTINIENAITRTSGQAASKIEYFINFFDGLDATGDDTYLWQSEEYASSSRARVVLTDNANYALSTKFQIQPVITWSDTEISIDKQIGSFIVGSTAYLHVFNSAGALVSSNAITV